MDRYSIDFSNFLPAIYQGEADGPDPTRTLVAIFTTLLESVESGLDRVPYCLDPVWAHDEPGHDDDDFLGWLARWVALDPEEDLPRPYGEGAAVTKDVERRRREVVGKAAELYRTRGTVQGLRHLLKMTCDVDIDIKEWAWPTGMQLGVQSSIGVDSFLTDQPNAWTCFVVVWRTRSFGSVKDVPGIQWLETTYGGDTGGGPHLTGIADSRESLARGDFGSRLAHMRRVLDRERPAHTNAYIAVQTGEGLPMELASIDAMVIGVSSTIGMCCIEWCGESERN